MACGFINYSRVGVITRLPTLTRTPLPTLTPTVVPEQALTTRPNVITSNDEGFSAEAVASVAVTPSEPNTAANLQTPAEILPMSTPAAVAVTVNSHPPTIMPTATTASATPTATPLAPTVTATSTPEPTSTNTPTATPIPNWVFNDIQLYPNPEKEQLLVYGNFTNNTEVAQEIINITGTFLDAQGQVIATTGSADAYWPGFVISPNGTMPFELKVHSIDHADSFSFAVEATPSSEAPREDFEFSDTEPQTRAGKYCVKGKLRNPGSNLQDYLTLTAVLYNEQGNVVNFGYYYHYYLGEGVTDDSMKFELCANSFGQNVARYRLLAWGL